MKKIVALVLALVLALSLATVAFAYSYSSTENKGTTSTLAQADKYALYGVNNNTKTVATFTSYTTMSTKVEVEDDETDTTYIPAYYTATFNAQETYFYETTEACADYRLFKGDEFVCYVNWLYKTDAALYMGYLPAADKFIEGDDSGDCGTYKVDVYVIDDKAYAANADGAYAVYDGKLVRYDKIGGAVSAIAHTWKMSKVEYKGTDSKGHQIPVAITCAACGEKFDIVKTLPVTYKGSYVTLAQASAQGYGHAAKHSSSKNLLTFTGSDYANYMIITGTVSTAAAGAAASGVTSAKTFDAGVALYAGMALMSVAGSAVVIGKKKEF